jgi:hypothetical protein
MTDSNCNEAREPKATIDGTRLIWEKPRLRRLNAGGAEFGPNAQRADGTFSDGPAVAS